jgi:hypothetical protein
MNFEFDTQLSQVILELARLHKLKQQRLVEGGYPDWNKQPWTASPKVSAEQVTSLQRRLGIELPAELLALAALGLAEAWDYGLRGVDHLGTGEFKPAGEEWDDWVEVTHIDPFSTIEAELDRDVDLPEVVALQLSSPEALEAPRWIVCLLPDGKTFGLVGAAPTKFDEPRTLATGTLADVYVFAVAALLERLPTYKKRLPQVRLESTEIPTVHIETAPAVPPSGGRMVSHPKFGLGRVIEETGEGENRKLTIAFEDVGTMTILARFVQSEDS